MYLPDAKSMVLQTNYGDEQYNALNISNLVRGYCAANNPFQILVQNLFRCFCKVSDCVAEMTICVRLCQNSWKNGQFSHFICRLSFWSVPLWKNQKHNQ